MFSCDQIHESSSLQNGRVSYMSLAYLTNVCDYLPSAPSLLCAHSKPTDFERAEAMLQPETYPEDLPSIQKQLVLQQQAGAVGLGKHFTAVRQTVAFHEKVNAAGVHLNASKLTGQDSVGLNDGSKNTVLTTYLADAFNFDAEMYVFNFSYVKIG